MITTQSIARSAMAALLCFAAVGCQTFSKEEADPNAPKEKKPLPFAKLEVKKVELMDDSPLNLPETEEDKAAASRKDASMPERKRAQDARPSLNNKPFAPSTGKGNLQEKIKLNLNLQAATVEHFVMAFADHEVLNFNYLVDPTVKGAITLNLDDVEMTRQEAWGLLEHLLWLSGAYMSENNNFVHILPFEKMPKEQKLYVTHEKQPNVQAMFVDIRYRKSADVVTFLKPFITDGASVTDIPDTNTIVIIETPANVEKLVELIKRLDSKGEGNWPVRCVACHEVDPEQIASELNTLLPVLGFPVAPATGPSGGAIKIAPLQRMNAIVISASMEEVVEEVVKWIKTLDKEDIADKEEIYFYNVRYATVDTLSTALEAFFNTTTTVGPTSSTSSSSSSSSSRRSSTSSSSTRNNSNNSNNRFSNNSNNRFGNNTNNNNNNNRNNNYSRTTSGTARTNNNATNNNSYNVNKSTLTVFETEVTVFTESESNRLTIKTTPRAWKTIKAFLQRQDVPPRQVAIRALITEIALNDSNQYGVAWSIDRMINGGEDELATFAGGITNVENGVTGKDIFNSWANIGGLGIFYKDGKNGPMALITAVAGKDNTKILSEPQIVARSGATAELQIGQSVPVATESVTYANSTSTTGSNFSTNYEYVETGVIMSVTPFITAGNEVRLEVEQEVSSAQENDDKRTPPTIDKKKMSTELVVPDGTTILLGGMIRTADVELKTGIPLLMDIPWLGGLFRGTTTKKVRQELLVLITVNVIDNKEPQEELLRRYKASLESIEEFNKQNVQY